MTNYIDGTSNNDSLVGTKDADYINGYEGNDTLIGLGGNDTILSGAGNNHIDGGSGDDSIFIGDYWWDSEVSDVIGGDGNDTITVYDAIDGYSVDGGAGTDRLELSMSNGLTPTSIKNVEILAIDSGTFAPDFLSTFSEIRGIYGNTYLNITLSGPGNADLHFAPDVTGYIQGSSGDDSISLATVTSSFFIFGSEGNDTLIGGAAGDHLADDEDIGADYTPGGNDLLQGGAGNDTLVSYIGIDTLEGGTGNDRLESNNYSDNSGIVTAPVLSGGDGDDTIVIADDLDSLTADGGAGSDLLVIYSSTNLENASATNIERASIYSVTASPEFLNSFSAIEGLSGQNYVTITFSTAGSAELHVVDGLTGYVYGSSGDDSISVATATGYFYLAGSDGNDTLVGGMAGDYLNGDESSSIQPASGNDLLQGGEGNDTLVSSVGSDTLDGGAGNDILRSYYYSSKLSVTNALQASGGDGDDKLYISNNLDSLIADGGAGSDVLTIESSAYLKYATATNIEALSLNYAEASAEFFNSFSTISSTYEDNYISLTLSQAGNIFPHIANGVNGYVQGSAGDDTINLSLATARFDIDGGEGNDTLIGGSAGDYLYGDQGSTSLTGSNNDFLVGGLGNDELVSNAGIDTLDGGAGDDSFEIETWQGSVSATVLGGDGNDTLWVSDEVTSLTLDGGNGTDFVVAQSATVFGGSVANTEVLVAGTLRATADLLNGFSEIRALSGSNTVTLSLFGGGAANLQLAAGVTGKVSGGYDAAGADVGSNDVLNVASATGSFSLYGLGGNDTLVGGSAGDFLSGGNGTDLASFSGSYKDYQVTYVDAGATSSLPAHVTLKNTATGATDTLLSIELVQFADGVFDINAIGPNLPPTGIALTGTSIAENQAAGTLIGLVVANDPEGEALSYQLLDTGGGLFTLWGNQLVTTQSLDFESLQSTAVTIEATDPKGNKAAQTIAISVVNIDEAPTGIALSKTSVKEGVKVGTAVGSLSATDPEGGATSFKLLDNAGGLFKLSGEKIIVAKPVDYGNVQADDITIEARDASGNKTTQVITIGVIDVLDTIKGTGKADKLTGDAGKDKLLGNAGNDILRGLGGDDQLLGGKGKDVLFGGLGADKLTGGGGADTFSYSAVTDSTHATSGRDLILDFDIGEGDRIDLSALDASSLKAGNQAFSFIKGADFSGKAGQLRFETSKGDTFIHGDTNGDKIADFTIAVDGSVKFTADLFIL